MKTKVLGFILFLFIQYNVLGQAAASFNYESQSGALGTTYNWIDCSGGTSIFESGDDVQTSVSWPFDFSFYDNNYTTSDSFSITTNGFIRLDGVASTSYTAASNYNLTSTATSFGQIIGLAIYDGNTNDNGSWIRYLVTGSAPNRILTIEYNNLEISWSDNRYADLQVSLYESTHKIVLKLKDENIYRTGVDMGLHSGVDGFFDKWQEVDSGTNNTWIEYTPPNVEVSDSEGTQLAFFTTLKDAFDKINDGTFTGDIVVKIHNSTSEYASSILNASGSGNIYTSVNIYPTKSGVSITGNLTSPLIDLKGADNVIIDGRVNATGTVKNLSLINLNTSNGNSTSTIRLINGATNNTIRYCIIKGAQTKNTSGVLLFSTSNSSSGNSNNLIDNNNITSLSAADRPENVIYSLGTNGKNNILNTISNNNVYDFFRKNSASNGIYLRKNSQNWTIDGNSFYETSPFLASNNGVYNVIKVRNNSINGTIIENNFIGGSAPFCVGNWEKLNGTDNEFSAIHILTGTTTPTSIQNNTIKNFDWKNSGNKEWLGIEVIRGNVNIGDTSGNTIGDITGTESIKVTGGTNTQFVYGIKIANTGIVNCNNNNIGSISGLVTSTNSTNLYGIHLSGDFTGEIKNNTIGSVTTGLSISASSVNSTEDQNVYGIYSRNKGATTFHENIISNLHNTTSTTNTNLRGTVTGLYVDQGANNINENTVNNLSTSSAFNNGAIPSAAGIYLNTKTDSQSIEENTIHNISNEFTSFTGGVSGIVFRNSAGASASSVNSNFIHSLGVSSNSGANIYGIYEDTDNAIISNNIITLGENNDTQMSGIYDVGKAGYTVKFYFNSIYLSGTNTGTSNSYALRYNTGNNTRDLRNNILFNNRTGGTGKHYAIYYNTTTGTFTTDYNDYFVNASGGVLGYFGGDQSDLGSLQTATSKDAFSFNTNPSFSDAGGTTYSDYITLTTLTGVNGTGVTIDYENIIRGVPPKIGALESSLGFVWQGNTSTDFATTSNWVNGEVPSNGSEISFATSPANDCILDSDRTLKSITNTSGKKFVVNGKQLTLTESIISTTANQIDAITIASSTVVFAGNHTQNIPDGVFVSNTIDALILNNHEGITQDGDLIIESALTLTLGEYFIGANTLTINGSISTTSGFLTGGSTSNISIGGSGASTGIPSIVANIFELNRANGITLEGNVTVNGSLNLTNGSLSINGNTLIIATNTIVITSGNIVANQPSDTVDFQNTTAYTIPLPLFSNSEIENFTISGVGGITVNNNITVNGVLNLQNSNPSATKGLLDVTLTDNSIYNELIMGPNSTTDGQGDVTGVISRYSFIEGNSYTFGNKNTSARFNQGATSLPTFLKTRVTIGTASGWLTDPINRTYDLIQDGGDTSIATFRASYLDSELNGNAEDELSFWTPTDYLGVPPPVDSGRSNFNLSENWLELADVNISYFPAVFGYFPITLDESGLSYKQWVGEFSTDWNNPLNWFPSGVPVITSLVRIPNTALTNFAPTLPPNATTEIMKIILESGSVINSGSSDNAALTLTDNIGTWSNEGGTFNPGNSTINFIRKNEATNTIIPGITTISGLTSFNNIYVGEFTTLSLVANSYVKVAGAITINQVGADRGVLNTAFSGKTTVDYNGANQTVAVTDLTSNKYYKLILSGTGIKTMPTTAMTIEDEFVLDGAITATAQSVLTIGNELEIVGGATFETGAFDHYIAGHFDVGGHLDTGTFTPTAGTTIFLNGTEVQNVYGENEITFEKLAINNNNGAEMYTDVNVNNELILTNGDLNIEESTLTIAGNLSKSAGYLNTNELSKLTFSGTTSLTLPSNLFPTTPSINILTINRTGGVISGSDIEVNGILDLQIANPSSGTIGSLDTGNFILHMGDTATNVGLGDVTGKIKRSTILPNIEYSFGNPNTSVKFQNIGILPSEITTKINIGSAPSWKTDGVLRFFDIAQIGASNDSRAIVKMHYLDSELNGLAENTLGLFSYVIPTATLIDRGLTEINTIDNWISLSNANFFNLPPIFGVIENGAGVSVADIITWDGSEDENWYDASNWTPAFAPDATKITVIPDATSTPNDPIITVSTTTSVKKMEIQVDGILNAGNGSEITIVGTSGAWINNGDFDANTSKVIFNSGNITEVTSIAGVTNFYNIDIGPNTNLQPLSGATIRIAGTGTATMTSVIDFSSVDNTVEWNGTDQYIVNPNGIGGNGGYFNLILSGSGTKTMQNSVMHIAGDFTTSGTVNAIANDSIKVDKKMTIGLGSSFVTGVFHHELSGDFENNGTFTGTSGGTMIFTGEEPQTISGTSTINFDNLTIEKTIENVTISSNIDVNNELLLNGGNLVVGNAILGVNGTISNPSGALEVSTVSNLNFGGTTALTLNNNLFSTETEPVPSLNNLTINNAGGITLGNQDMTVNVLLDLPSGTLTLNGKTLNLAGVSPTRTSGDIDASSTSSEISFSNTSAITLPLSFFNGNISNFSISGTGGVIVNEDITVTGILNLESSNPSATKGSLSMESSSILDMDVNAITTGIGDVTGIVKREHAFNDGIEYSFGNQFTTMNFLDVPGNEKPKWIQCKITIGTVPTWKNDAIKRNYSFSQFQGDGTDPKGTDRMIFRLHYLDSELNGLDESQLVYWDAYDPDFGVNNFVKSYARSYNDRNTTDNWVQLNGPSINYISTSDQLDVKQWGLGYSYSVHLHTWTGNGSPSFDGDWSLPGNWQGGVPIEICPILIPNPVDLPSDNNGDLHPYRNLLPILTPAQALTLEIAALATLSATDYDIAIYGDTNAWVNNGTFIPGTANVIFANGDNTNIATISGATNFYNLTVNDKTQIQPAAGSIVRIENAFHIGSGSFLDFSTTTNTIEYYGTDQTVIYPNGGSTGYYNLSLSGIGIKTMPSTSFNIINNLDLSESANATTTSDLTIGADLNLSDTSILTIGAAKTLTVSGAIDNTVGNESFVLQSNVNGTASLIHNTDNVPATVERYISGAAEDWHFLSSPVSGQTIASSNWVPSGSYGNGTGYDLYVWDEPTPCWVYHKNDGGVLPYDSNNPDWPHVHSDSEFIAGRGYLYSVEETNPTKEFKGNLNNGNVSYPLTAISTADPLLTGFNLIGNPYPSSIDWKASGWTRSNLLDSGIGSYDMWIWNPAANNYGVFNSTGTAGTNGVTQYIAPMQGFFVRADSNADIEMTNDVRVHTGANNWFKPNNSQKSTVKVNINSKSKYGYDEVLLKFESSSNFAGAAKLYSTAKTAPSTYLKFGDEELSVQYLTNTIENPSVPIMFKSGSEGDYEFIIDFDYSYIDYVVLEDKKTKEFHDLMNNPIYEFKSSVDDKPERFVLHFTPQDSDNNESLSAHIFYDGNNVIVDLTLVPEKTDILIYDMLGKLLLQTKVSGGLIHKLSVNKINQVLIVTANNIKKSINKKVVIY